MRKDEVFAERFRIDRFGGAGACGKVYRAIDTDGSAVALKVLQGGHRNDRFAREARILASIDHPGIVRYVTHGETLEGESFLVTEWLDGETLSARLGADRLSVAEAIELGYRVATALEAAHLLGVVHRDLKPANLFLVNGRIEAVKVLDFGVARLLDRGQALTATGVTVGIMGYMAPEQARGQRDLDARADLFALGCVLFQCLTGQPPFVGDDVLTVLLKVITADVARVQSVRPEVPEALDALIAAMLAKDPSERPGSSAAVAAALDAMRTGRQDVVPRSRRQLTGLEQRVMSLMLAGARSEATIDEARADGLADNRARAVQVVADRHGGQLELLGDGTALITFTSGGTAVDLATRAARCALALQPLLGSAPIVVASGLGVLSARMPIGEIIDRAVRRLARTRPDAVWIDEVTQALLGPAFVTVLAEGGAELKLEGEADQARTLLGRPTSCIGRARELGLLETTLAECVEDSVARAVLITGEPGSGKSRLRYELLRQVRRSGGDVEIWMAHGEAFSQSSAFSMLAQILRRAAGISDGEPISIRREKLLRRISQHVAAEHAANMTDLLGELIGAPAPPGQAGPELTAAYRDPAAMGERLRRAWEDFVAAECAARPVALVLEDLHWGDLPTINFVEAALRSAAQAPLFVLALARPEVRSSFPRLFQWPELQEVKLPKLTRRACERLIREVLGDGVSPALVETMLDRADGNAFYLEELIRSAAERREDAVPASVISMAQSRLDALPSESRRILRAASVLGTVFWRGGVAALLKDERSDDQLEVLTRREVITPVPEPRFPGQAEYRFRHALLRDAAYALLTDADRALGHRLAAEWLEGVGEGDPVTIAEHFDRGGLPERAARHYLAAAEQAAGRFEAQAALELARRAARGGLGGEELGRARLVEATAELWWGAEISAARSAIIAAIDLLPRGGDPWCEAVGLAINIAQMLGEREWLIALVDDLESVGAKGTTSSRYLFAATRGVTRLAFAGELQRAASLLAFIDERARAETDMMALGSYFQARAALAVYTGDQHDALDLVDRSARCFERAGNRRGFAIQRANWGTLAGELGRYDEAEHALREAETVSHSLGSGVANVFEGHNLGVVLGRLGRLDEALKVEEAAAQSFVARGDLRLEGSARTYVAEIHALASRLDAAEAEAERALACLAAAPSQRALALAVLAGVRLDRGRPEDALVPAEEAYAILVSLGGLEERESLVRLRWAEALAASGRAAEAAAVLEEAAARLLARADRIAEPVWRERFLRGVPENARTLELAARALYSAAPRGG
jgi:tetratricopeptide (TPR) repeat protein